MDLGWNLWLNFYYFNIWVHLFIGHWEHVKKLSNVRYQWRTVVWSWRNKVNAFLFCKKILFIILHIFQSDSDSERHMFSTRKHPFSYSSYQEASVVILKKKAWVTHAENFQCFAEIFSYWNANSQLIYSTDCNISY